MASVEGAGADYADGSVHVITVGATELRSVLDSAAQRAQLVVVDFSASWCGPCKRMLPVLEQMAQQHVGKVVFCKVDCEQSSANQQLAAEAVISAFPTFHVYRAGQRVAEFRGANPQQLQQAIQQQLPLLAPPAAPATAAAPTAAAAGPPGPMATALAQALATVRASCSFDDFVAAARTLLTFVSNVLANPDEPKYRRIRLSNAAFQSKLGSKPGGKECMAALGFVEVGEEAEGEGPALVMHSIPSELPQVKSLLEQAVPGASQAAPAPSPAASGGSSAAAARPWAGPAAGAAAGNSGAGGAGGAGNVDAAALARALAAVMQNAGAGAGAAGGAGARGAAAGAGQGAPAGVQQQQQQHAAAGGGGRGGPPHPGRRVLRLTPAMLARMLEKVLRDGGFGAPPAAAP